MPAVRPYKGLQLCLNLASSDYRLRTNPPPPLLASSNYPSTYIIAPNEANALRDFALNEGEEAENRVSFAFLKQARHLSFEKFDEIYYFARGRGGRVFISAGDLVVSD